MFNLGFIEDFRRECQLRKLREAGYTPHVLNELEGVNKQFLRYTRDLVLLKRQKKDVTTIKLFLVERVVARHS